MQVPERKTMRLPACPDGGNIHRLQFLQTVREYDDDLRTRQATSLKVCAVRGRGRSDWVCGIAGRRLNMLATDEQLSSAEHDHNDRADRCGWNICHADRSTPINYGVTAILPSGRVHDADQRLAHQF